MANGNGISGLSLAFATAGGILVYAGFKGVNPLTALREVSLGKPTGVDSRTTDLGTTLDLEGAKGLKRADGSAGVTAAAQKYVGDKYSQAKRTQVGWSDCSSFCDKILTDIGVPPPVKWASTANYRISPYWKTIPLSETMPGDIAVNGHHMVMITAPGGTAAIGQQNPRVNVRTGTVASLMSNDFVCKRHTGSTGTAVTT
jgi:hypothetical protein